jgi:DNA-binding IclR family transcriptional regulator
MGAGDMQEIARQSNLDERTVRHTLQTLLRRDLVLYENGAYRIAAPIFSQWVELNS